jgi:hypothetical protein
MLMKRTGLFTVVNPVLLVVNVSAVAVKWWKVSKNRGVSLAEEKSHADQ